MLDIHIVSEYLPMLCQAAGTTVELTLLATILGLVIGLAAALGRLSRHAAVRAVAGSYVWLIRSTPLLVQLFIIYFGLPQFGVELSPFASGVIGLALNVGAYNAETIRAGILAVPHGQIEASRSLGFGAAKTMRLVILPQALRLIVPPLGNNLIILTKDTSLVSTITLAELFMRTQQLVSATFKPFELYFACAMIYAVLTTATSLVLRQLERRLVLQGGRA
ncbi:amino acid ABC transporter permease [Verminephrobacter aporrectodeae]|uniref:Amino acid ABC transporter permease n=1 Tax=Verminephrobacter aporrectodeae subsp. tuberculatae TaxID=1110392 RepID=A0ABT3KU67_9BURK|nr:amino acid ABC transporter permease [Verminephrobacter aporrectodeae]MCW5222291.1 amino acid ABC transporter permease [Verminephrobacter aporrectodeae subsp. tuberculatae]MCW5257497.1 amino acid ABC transporter permease [Verminephrobacter aporrectodeae subsp. tuberculatae]MCW5287755.1 amino acid ABC transporter permease [Verminephrobacter aporrectodeae subsp. tuberculatae]MCW5321320.1 amino acid ABC transporter permease [Verminephrobacter aporrectodeae subsp. tuberculatae]MCW8165436.1 amino